MSTGRLLEDGGINPFFNLPSSDEIGPLTGGVRADGTEFGSFQGSTAGAALLLAGGLILVGCGSAPTVAPEATPTQGEHFVMATPVAPTENPLATPKPANPTSTPVPPNVCDISPNLNIRDGTNRIMDTSPDPYLSMGGVLVEDDSERGNYTMVDGVLVKGPPYEGRTVWVCGKVVNPEGQQIDDYGCVVEAATSGIGCSPAPTK